MNKSKSMGTLGVLLAVMLVISVFLTQKAVAAWETDTDRQGMDYKSFWIDKDIEPFVAVKQCEDACKNDSQCKAFTYVKAGVQGTNARCYLKKGVPSPVKNTCCTSGVVRPETKADYCNNYALTAVQFNKSNTNWKCGYTGNRWSDNYKLHYNWCMQVQESASKHEADERKKLMDQCLKPSKAGDLSAHDWCYEIDKDADEISFCPVIKNEGKTVWKSNKEGYYKVAVWGPTGIKEKKYILPAFPYWYLEPNETSILEGLTLSYHQNNSYGVENLWILNHPEDTNKSNDSSLGLKGFYKGASFKTDPTLLAKMCRNELLIIAHEDFLGTLAPLKEHKERTGIKTHIESWQSLTTRFNGIDSPEKIKKGIVDYKKKHRIRWVMLVGDSDKFPVRYVCRDDPDPKGYQSADLYYADLFQADGSFATWDANNNGLFAQSSGTKQNNIDKVDWHPDVAVARVPASTNTEVQNYVDKVILYENQTQSAPWFKTVLLSTGDWGDSEGISDFIANNYLQGFTLIKHYHGAVWKLYPIDKNNLKASMDKRASPMTDYINKGVGFINYSGHGTWNDFAGVYNKRHLNDLTNSDKLSVVFAHACSTGEFAPSPPWQNYYDVKGVFHPSTERENLQKGKVPKPDPIQPGSVATHNCDLEARGEDWLVYRKTGAIAYLGSAGIVNPGYADKLDKDFFKAYHAGARTLGDVWIYSIECFLHDYGYFDQQGNTVGKDDWNRYAIWNALVRSHAFGDPSLRIGGISGK